MFREKIKVLEDAGKSTEAKMMLIDSPYRGDILMARKLIAREKSITRKIDPELDQLLKLWY